MPHLLLPVPAVKTISLGGGGARGCVYGPVLEELNKTEVLAGTESILGVSAGSITGALLALGADPVEITVFAQKTKFTKLLGESSFFKEGRGIFKTQTLEKTVNDTLNLQRNKRIQELRVLCESSSLSDKKDIQAKIDALESQDVTFSTLNQLRELFVLLGQPHKIKALSILAVQVDDGKPFVFSNGLHPTVRIADAVTASSAIPPVFKAHNLNINGKKTAFIDGGMHRSLLSPHYQIPDFVTTIERKLNSVLLWLYPEDTANEILHGPTKSLNVFMIFIGYLIKLIFHANGVQAKFDTEQDAKAHGQNIIPMNVNINPNDFGVDTAKKEALGKIAVASVKNYFFLYRKNAVYRIEGVSIAHCLYQVPFLQWESATKDLINRQKLVVEEELLTLIYTHRERQKLLGQEILEIMNRLRSDSTLLELKIMAYCKGIALITDEESQKAIVDTNMERLLHGTQHQLGSLFSIINVSEEKEPYLFKLQKLYRTECLSSTLTNFGLK